jgi:methylglyoxal synthase
MSSDPSKRQDRFRLTAAVTIGALLLAALGLTVANARQGPRLLDAQINPGAAVEGAGERLILRVDQIVAESTADQVTVTPTVPVEPTSDGAALILRFGDSLSYATTYEILAKVQSGTTGASATLRYSFRTPDGAFYNLRRAASGADTDAPDQIVHHLLGSTEQRVVRSQPRIEKYAVADPMIAVVASDAAGASTLTVGPLDGSEPTQTLADNSDISQLKSSGPSGLLGFVLTPLNDPDRGDGGQLHLYDPVAGKLIKVSGFDGKPLEPLDWAFVPGTTSIVVQTADNSFYLIDPLNNTPTQTLGSHSRMYGFVPGSTTLIVDDSSAYKAIDLATGNTSTAIDSPGSADFHELLPLGGDRGYVGLLATDAGALSVVVINDGNVRQIYAEDPDPVGGIQSVCLSPNGQYLAVAKLPRDAATNPDSLGLANRTEFIDTATGQIEQDVAGSKINWCN